MKEIKNQQVRPVEEAGGQIRMRRMKTQPR